VHVFDNVLQVPLMDKAGRRPLLIIPMIVMIINLIGMTVCLVLQVSLHTTFAEL